MKLFTAFKKVAKSLPLLVRASENYFQDGKIDAKERKPLVMAWIRVILQGVFDIKLNWFMRLVLSYLVDKAARKLPSVDIYVPPLVKEFA